jgi:hypothetical protein
MLEQWGNLEVEVAQRALECMADAEATRVEISRVLLNPLREKLPKNSSEGRSPIPASASRRFTLSDVDMIVSSVDDRWRVFSGFGLPDAAAALKVRTLYCRSVWWQISRHR